MVPRCARPGCDRPAEVALGYDTSVRTAWLASDLAEGALAVCIPHAERMAVPNGWRLEDRRSEGGAEAVAVAVAVPVAADDEADLGRWEPRFDAADDLGGLLAARTPLLSRAFGGGGPAPEPRRRRRPPRPSAASG